MRLTLLLILLLGGCNGTGHTSAPPAPTPTEVTNTVPKERDLLESIDYTNYRLDEIAATQKELDRSRTEAAKELAKAQADIRAKEAETHAANQRAQQAEAARIALEAADAAQDRRIAYATATVGGGAILIGGVLAWLLKSWRIAAIVCGGGVLMLVLSTVLTELGSTLVWTGRIGAAVAIAGGLFAVGTRAWTNFVTNQQAQRQMKEAARLLASADADDRKRGAVLLAAAQQLTHVSSKAYDPSRVEPSSVALKALGVAM